MIRCDHAGVSGAREASALREAARTSDELAELGVRNQHLVVNGVFQASDTGDPYAVALQQRGAAALGAMPISLKTFPQTIVPLSPQGILGIDALRALLPMRGRATHLRAHADEMSADLQDNCRCYLN